MNRKTVLQVLRLGAPGVRAGSALAALLARCHALEELDLSGSAVALDDWLAVALERHTCLRALRVSLARRALGPESQEIL